MIPSDLLVSAYASGWFPMAVDEGDIRWYSPDPRGIIPLERFHVPSRLARVVRAGRFRVEIDTAFETVMRACAGASRKGDDGGTWIDDEILETYCALHAAGLAHSVEVWQGDDLAGGLYGVALGGAFFGESMFHRVTDASKVALVGLVAMLSDEHAPRRLVDVQWATPHLASLGVVEVSRGDYTRLLAGALDVPLPRAFDPACERSQ